ncbi:MAG TPA: hypothetical protein VFT45_04580, partial [Longimicrobium sp.]|nr:hypothetical protein [Longimicrobium sp.]
YSAGSPGPTDSLVVTEQVTSLAFARKGDILAIGDGAGRVWLWSPLTDSRRVLDGGRGGITSLAFDPQGRILAGGDAEGDIMLWDLGHGDRTESPPRAHDFGISALAFSGDGSTLVSGDTNGNVALWDVSSRLVLARSLLRHRSDVVGLAFAGDSGVLVSADESGFVERTDIRAATWVRRACRIANWDAREEEWRRRFPTHEFPRACRHPPGPAGARPAR